VSVHPDPSTFVRSADVWARAIIAAARVYGEDPVEALTVSARRGRFGKRRSLAAACCALAEGLEIPLARAARPLGLNPNVVYNRRKEANRQFKDAQRAAAGALDYAYWHPWAAESVAQAVGELDLTGEAGAEAAGISWEVQLIQAVAALPPLDLEPAPEPLVAPVIRPHAPLAGRVNLANGHAFAPPFRPGPPPSTETLEGRILAQLAQRPGSPRGLASILDIKETFVAQTLRNLAREGRVSADALAPGVGDRDQAWRRA
jgi:hypothetical protein